MSSFMISFDPAQILVTRASKGISLAVRRRDLDQSNEQLRTIASNHDLASPPR